MSDEAEGDRFGIAYAVPDSRNKKVMPELGKVRFAIVTASEDRNPLPHFNLIPLQDIIRTASEKQEGGGEGLVVKTHGSYLTDTYQDEGFIGSGSSDISGSSQHFIDYPRSYLEGETVDFEEIPVEKESEKGLLEGNPSPEYLSTKESYTSPPSTLKPDPSSSVSVREPSASLDKTRMDAHAEERAGSEFHVNPGEREVAEAELEKMRGNRDVWRIAAIALLLIGIGGAAFLYAQWQGAVNSGRSTDAIASEALGNRVEEQAAGFMLVIDSINASAASKIQLIQSNSRDEIRQLTTELRQQEAELKKT